MKTSKILRFFLVCLFFFQCAPKTLAEDGRIPVPVGDIYVQDFAQVLNETEKAELIGIGRSIEDRTSAQVAVLTVKTIGNGTIEEYANQAYRQYGIGSKGENNGVLLVLSIKEQKIRIEVGYGLEGRIPDGKAGRILDEYAIPYLQNQQPDKAVVETYKALGNEVLAEYGITGDLGGQPAQDTQRQAQENQGLGIPSWLILIILAIIIFLDFKFFGGTLTYLLLSIISRGRGGGGGGFGGGSRGGGGGSSGGGGASRGW